jgi:SAM-dependent methyltransferase
MLNLRGKIRSRVARRRELERETRRTLSRLERDRAEAVRRLDEIAAELQNLRWWLQQTSDRGDETAGRLEHALGAWQEIGADLQRRVPADVPLYGEGGLELETFDSAFGVPVVGFRAGRPDEGDGVYVGFEEYFRGSEDEVRRRQEAYLPLMRGRSDVLDIGCGRGEFLDVMREAGISARGIDLDPAMVQRASSRGLDVEQADATTYLDAVTPGSLGAIFAAQVIEHLSYEDLLLLLRLAHAKLAAGGILVVETVNPHAPQALKHFWIDPTHRNPLFPETVLALCRLTGFASGYIWYPQGTGDPDRDRSGQLDYAVVAEAPGTHGSSAGTGTS